MTRPGGQRRRWLLGVVVAASLLLPLLATLHVRVVGPEPHGLVLGVVGPAPVVQEMARRVDGLAGRPFDARQVPAVGSALRTAQEGVADGRLDAAVVVDLRVGEDVLVVPSTTSAALVREVRLRLVPVSAGLGRGLRAAVVPPARSPDAWRGVPFALVVAWMLLGLGAAAVLCLLRGPVAPTASRGLGRLVLLAAGGALGGLAGALALPSSVQAPLGPLVAAGTLTVVVSGWFVLACEALLGLPGLAVAVGTTVGPLAPFLSQVRPDTMPDPWPWVYLLGPHAAALDVTTGLVFGRGLGARPWLLLGAWAVICFLLLGRSRRLRPDGALDPARAGLDPVA